MRKISKQVGFEPASLSQFKRRNKQGNYSDLTVETRQDIRLACTIEQFYLCAYCCKQISGSSDDTMNEHVIARKTAPHKSLDYTNIVASCTTANQCDNAHGSQTLPLTPFDVECETDLDFKLSGRVVGLTDDAQKTIGILNLNNKSLNEQRKIFIDTILFTYGENAIEDDYLINIMIDELAQLEEGKLEAFAPVVINVLRGWVR
ncbi:MULTISPECIES: TIGR02646 family protein [Psychrobacter]|uniref:TIGR02646 family protein n=1 Tax=Psychrobacter TaxID=497 RepID=UPI00191827D5|nr:MULTISPECIES: TIGR02646 family protein [Psychrobacter]